MKTRLWIIGIVLLIGGSISSWIGDFTGQELDHQRNTGFILSAFGQCIVNEDWSDAPCLDSITNGRYNQEDVNIWTAYYQYKGPIFMEEKHSELNNAIRDNHLKEWVNESTQNRNVYEYYFFSGRAPHIGEYLGQFDVIKIKENLPPHDPYTDDESLRVASAKKFIAEESNGGGSGMGFFDSSTFDVRIIIIATLIGAGSGIGLTLYWRKRK
jgi:hypothetical protein